MAGHKGAKEDADAALVLAARCGDFQAALAALENGADPRSGAGTGEPALFFAVRMADAGMLRLLLERGADPCARDAAGDTALHRAIRYGNAEAARILAPVSDLRAGMETGRSALHAALSSGDLDLAAPVLDAAEAGHWEGNEAGLLKSCSGARMRQLALAGMERALVARASKLACANKGRRGL